MSFKMCKVAFLVQHKYSDVYNNFLFNAVCFLWKMLTFNVLSEHGRKQFEGFKLHKRVNLVRICKRIKR